MTNSYHDYKNKASEKKDPLDPQCVFKIKHSDIPKGITQCQTHQWIKLSDNEVKCIKCPTALIVSSEYLKQLLYGNN
jgi:hypothetical protein